MKSLRYHPLEHISHSLCISTSKLHLFQVPGAVVGEGSRLVLGGVGRGEGGLYQCQASNGVEEEGEQITANIRLTVHCEWHHKSSHSPNQSRSLGNLSCP